MTKDVKVCHVASSGNIITPSGRASYAQYLVAPQENQGGKLKYNLNLLLPADRNLDELKKKMGKIALEKLDGDKTRAKNMIEKRFLDPNNLPNNGKPAGDEFEGWTLLRASSDYKPKFVYPNGQEVPAEELSKDVYSGRWVRATLNPYWSANKENPGVFLGLQNIQLLDHDENLGVSIPEATDEFGAVSDEGPEAGSTVPDSDVDAMFG